MVAETEIVCHQSVPGLDVQYRCIAKGSNIQKIEDIVDASSPSSPVFHQIRPSELVSTEKWRSEVVSYLFCCSRGELLLPLSVRLSTALIDMYAKCGNLCVAKKLFDGMHQRNTISWNAMLVGVVMHGDGESALMLFFEMQKMFRNMCTVYGIEPKSEHYGCMVDFLGRVGLFEEAKEIIQRIPNSIKPSEEAIAWRALLTERLLHKIVDEVSIHLNQQGKPLLDSVENRELVEGWGLSVEWRQKLFRWMSWQPPIHGWVCLNTNGSITTNRGGYGAIIHDDCGNAIIVVAGSLVHDSVVFVELLAIKRVYGAIEM
ncbi:hypothetical protein HHK36_020907 [Tetracentron sinense]|uniref:Pentatricopeptide repeat-containing protein n=1 Tax=Tetracentron sinense TaxID=13715 RepID=A0A834YVZ8_TETSI|nr:hypothetical protein HHK36_020907 [Tetracentron sinense]